MILLDTNIVSEGLRPRPSEHVKVWTDAQAAASLYLCTPVIAELRFGIERLGIGRRNDDLRHAIDRIENDLFRDRILSFDLAAARAYAQLFAARQQKGRRIDVMDGLVAAIALSQGAVLATRNISHFEDIGLE